MLISSVYLTGSNSTGMYGLLYADIISVMIGLKLISYIFVIPTKIMYIQFNRRI